MKATLKWIGIAIAVIIALAIYSDMGESDRRWWSVALVAGWFFWFAGKEWDKAKATAQRTLEAVQRVEEQLARTQQEVYALSNEVDLISSKLQSR